MGHVIINANAEFIQLAICSMVSSFDLDDLFVPVKCSFHLEFPKVLEFCRMHNHIIY